MVFAVNESRSPCRSRRVRSRASSSSVGITRPRGLRNATYRTLRNTSAAVTLIVPSTPAGHLVRLLPPGGRSDGAELARYTLSGGGSHTAQIMAKISRISGAWQPTAIGEPACGATFQDLLPALDRHL